MSAKSSELIYNKDGSLYHLGLRKGELAPIIITVGDPERVEQVSRYFSSVELRRQNREFVTHTGLLENLRLSVISTGIGTDNIDIVINEIHALFNDGPGQNNLPLTFIRLGTSGSIREDIPVDSILASEGALGFDGLMHFYQFENRREEILQWRQKYGVEKLPEPYLTEADQSLLDHFAPIYQAKGVTVTAPGFYGPQGRMVNAELRIPDYLKALSQSSIAGMPITNIEMETAGIYGLCQLLGHRAISLSAILANRVRGEFSTKPADTVRRLIEECLPKISELH